MASIRTSAGRRRTPAQRRRLGVLLGVLLLVAPVLGLIFAAVYFGMRDRRRAVPRTAADVAAAPVRSADAGSDPARTSAIVAALKPTIGKTLTGAAAIAVGVLLASTAAAGSFALLNSRANLSSGAVTLTAGTLSLALNGSSASTVALPAGFSKLLPGDYYSQAITVANTGNTPGNLTARLAAAPAPYDIRISTTACSSTGYGTTAAGTAIGTADTAFGTLPANTSATGCLLVGLSSSAPTTTNSTATVSATVASASFAITFTATQPSS